MSLHFGFVHSNMFFVFFASNIQVYIYLELTQSFSTFQ